MDIDVLLSQARLPERSITLCLRGDLQAEWEDLARQRAELLTGPGAGSLAGSPTRAIDARMEELRGQMAEAEVRFRVRALSHRDYQRLTDAHPPRVGPDGKTLPADLAEEVNTETFWPALVRACLVEPDLSDEQLAKLLDTLSDRQYGDLARCALTACKGDVSVPFSYLDSATSPTSETG